MIYKTSLFTNENEIRLVLDQYNAQKCFKINFRERNNFIIPYVETNGLLIKDTPTMIPKLPPIKRILVAPCQYQDDVIKSIEKFMVITDENIPVETYNTSV